MRPAAAELFPLPSALFPSNYKGRGRRDGRATPAGPGGKQAAEADPRALLQPSRPLELVLGLAWQAGDLVCLASVSEGPLGMVFPYWPQFLHLYNTFLPCISCKLIYLDTLLDPVFLWQDYI